MQDSAIEAFPQLRLRLHTQGMAYRASMELQLDANVDPIALASEIPIALDLTSLLGAIGELQRYGLMLSHMLFVPELRLAWRLATAYSIGRGQPLRLRLQIPASAGDEVHSVRWELLADPQSGDVLSLSDATLFSRSIESQNIERLAPSNPSRLRALIAVSAPPDLDRFQLHTIDAPAEECRASEAFGSISIARLGGGLGKDFLTRENLERELHLGCDILYLVAHGKMINGDSTIFLEDNDGKCKPVAGRHLVDTIARHHRPPRLMVLAVCESAGTGGHSTAGALGPQLVAGKVGAVIAMQGMASFTTIERFTPAFFGELMHAGDIEQALAVARRRLIADDTWWQPTLFTRLAAVQLWDAAPAETLERIARRQRDELLAQLREPSRPAPTRVAAAAELASLGELRPGICMLPPIWSDTIPAGVYAICARERQVDTELRQASLDPEAHLSVGTFRIARYPITIWQYQQFIAAGGYAEDRWWTEAGRRWRRAYTVVAPAEWERTSQLASAPLTGVSWYEAMAFCRWLHAQGHHQGWLTEGMQLRLPTEAEWELAAAWDASAGAVRQWAPPDNRDTWASTRESLPQHGRFPPPVGCFPQGISPCGAYDMAGGVWEWCASRADAYPERANALADDFPFQRGPLAGPVQRGGSFRDRAAAVGWFARRGRENPGENPTNVGFRVVMSVSSLDS